MIFEGLELIERNGKWYFENVALAEQHKHLTEERGPQQAKLEAFKATYKLKELFAKRNPGWCLLAPKEFEHETRYAGGIHTCKPGGRFALMANTTELRIVDHYKFFRSSHGSVWVTQPYNLDLASYQAFAELWRGLGRFVAISYIDAWWYPGRTPLVALSDFELHLQK